MYLYVPGAMGVVSVKRRRRQGMDVGETLPYTHQGRSGLQGTRNNISLPPRNSSHIAGLAETQAGLASYCHQAEAVSKAPGITFHCLCSVPGPPHCRLSTCIDIWQQPESAMPTVPQPHCGDRGNEYILVMVDPLAGQWWMQQQMLAPQPGCLWITGSAIWGHQTYWYLIGAVISSVVVARKFAPRWEGPFVITECIGDNLYQVENERGFALTQLIHVSWMQEYKGGQNTPTEAPEVDDDFDPSLEEEATKHSRQKIAMTSGRRSQRERWQQMLTKRTYLLKGQSVT
ncbi:hypothetical protein Pelo_4385 [Pelomyxa schiedti]|nr:hypothetical protein Pelo_4385 [Pelomyxa schiedti]